MSSQPIYCEWMGLSDGGNFFASCSFGDTWGILLLLALLEALVGRQFSWWKVTFFLSSFLLVFLLIVTWCIVLHLHCSPGVLLGLFVYLPF